ncbi:MAG: CocE/NonD family hydrolase [Mycobacteriales bacterium]|nr:CocE/NonD family hydrolase [Mycobacteriales bacterium]
MRRLVPLLLPALLLPVLLAASPARAEEEDFRTVEGKSEPTYKEFVDEEHRIETPHGTIYGVVRRPVVEDDLKVPVILTYTPYNILERPVATMVEQTDAVTTYFTPRGYARASFDLVGTRESSGCYDHGGIRERETAKAVVDYLGTRDWSNGKVGMIGGSYDGTTQWAGAIEQPEHLTTIVPQVGIGRWYDYAYGQGVRFYSGSGTPALFDFGFGFAPPTGVTGGTAWLEAVQAHATPCERVEHNDRAFLPDPVYDGYWDERDYLAQIAKVQASVLVVGSWTDYNVHPVNSVEMWEALPDDHPKKLVMGLSGHSGDQVEDNEDIYHAWFDHWLLGLDTGVMDLPRSDSLLLATRDAEAEDPTAPERRQDSHWPPLSTVDVALGLAAGDERFGVVATPATEVIDWVDDQPALSEDDVLSGASVADGRSRLFLGAPVDGEVRISGVARLDVTMTTSEVSTHVTPVLFRESVGGARTVLTRGLLNSRNRDGLDTSTDLVPGAPWRGTVVFQPVDALLREGERLGLAVMSMNAFEALYPDTTLATNVLDVVASRLVVPVSLGAERLGTAVTAPVPALPGPVVVAPTRPAPAAPTLPTTGGSLPAAALGAAALLAAGLVRRARRV